MHYLFPNSRIFLLFAAQPSELTKKQTERKKKRKKFKVIDGEKKIHSFRGKAEREYFIDL